MEQIQKQVVKFFSNGGKRDLFYLSLIGSIILFLMRTSATFGEYRNKWNEVEKRVSKIECIEQDIKEMRNDITWIKMYVKGEIRK